MSNATQTHHRFETMWSLGYLLHIPTGYADTPAKAWPLIVFLHGRGERGADLELLKAHGVPKVVAQDPDFPFVTLSPQCPAGLGWPHLVIPLRLLINEMIARYRIDPDRVYLTGLSMGGHGSWELAMTYPDLFAAVAPVCGRCPVGYEKRVLAIAHLPVWAFHGQADPVVSLVHSARMVEALRAAGADPRFTIYPGVQHASWEMAYADPALYEWFLQHTRQPAPPHAED